LPTTVYKLYIYICNDYDLIMIEIAVIAGYVLIILIILRILMKFSDWLFTNQMITINQHERLLSFLDYGSEKNSARTTEMILS
jgi:hypothetical protein